MVGSLLLSRLLIKMDVKDLSSIFLHAPWLKTRRKLNKTDTK